MVWLRIKDDRRIADRARRKTELADGLTARSLAFANPLGPALA